MKTELSEHALERRIKRYILKEKHDFFAGCAIGFESILKQELSAIPELQFDNYFDGGIEFSGSIDLMYFANYSSRIANRILLRIGQFKTKSYPELFNKCKRLSWELYLGISPDVSFEVTAKSSRLHHTANIENSIFEAIENYYSQFGIEVKKTENSKSKIYVRLFDDNCTISIDTSGDHLHKRGYKKYSVDAPIRETIASGILLQSRKKESAVIIDPFCGSGTFLFEYILASNSIQPGFVRKYSFEHFPFFNQARWNKIKNIFPNTEQDHSTVKYLGFDVDVNAIHAANENIKSASIFRSLKFDHQDFFELKNTFGSDGLIISNPPYGKRVGGSFEDMIFFYERMGNHLRKEFSGWDFLFILAHPAYITALKLTAGREMKFNNGGIDVKAIWGRI